MMISLSTLFAQGTKVPARTELSVEIDPITFAAGGYSAHLRIKPKMWEHILLGGGIYAMNMPQPIVNMNPENKNQGWQVRLNLGLGAFGEYFFSETNKKFFVGLQSGYQEYQISNREIEGHEKFGNVLFMGYGGYSLQPFKFPLYFKGWAGVGYTSQVSGENVLNGKEYQVAPVTMFATLHIGYTFK